MGIFTRLLSVVDVKAVLALPLRLSRRCKRSPDAENSSTMAADDSSDHHRIAGQLAGAVAHDLNNLLATVLGCLELMERRLDDPERLKALIKRSSDAVERAAGLTSRLAQFARRQPRPRSLTDVSTVVADLTPLMVSALGRRVRVSTELSLAPEPVQIDPVGLEATILAICLAMRAAIPETGHIAVTIQLSGPSRSVLMRVTGFGSIHLDLQQARCVAAAAGVAIRLGGVTEGVEVAVLLPSADEVVSSAEPRLPPIPNPDPPRNS